MLGETHVAVRAESSGSVSAEYASGVENRAAERLTAHHTEELPMVVRRRSA